MDAEHFDTWTRLFSRRRIFLSGAVTGLATSLGWHDADDADAAKGRHKRKKRKKKCAKAGQAPNKKRKQCCKGLVKDGNGRCAAACDVCARGCPFTSVQAAIEAASPGATVTICAGTFPETILIAKNLTLVGTGDGAGGGNTIFDGTGAGSVVTIGFRSFVALQNLRITGGQAPNDGGGIANFGTLTLTDCTINGNSAGSTGGGIYNDGLLTLSGCTVSGNTASFGGGISSDSGVVELTDSLVRQNMAVSGGGIESASTLTLTGCTVSDNTAVSFGGGIVQSSSTGTLTLTNSTVSDNLAGEAGGGIYNDDTVACDVTGAVSGNTAGIAGTENCFDASGGTGCDTCNS